MDMDKFVIEQFNKDLLAKKAGALCQAQAKHVPMAGYGQKADGEHLNKLRNASAKTENEKSLHAHLRSEDQDTENKCNRIQKQGKENEKEYAALTAQTRKAIMQEGSLTIEEQIPHEDSSTLSGVLKRERSSSVQELNKSSKLLVGLAKNLLQGKIDEETGEVIIKPNINEIDSALRLLEGARNIQKTKLDFLKFGKDLI